MTDEQINQRIAEVCGWTRIEQQSPSGRFWGQHPSCPDKINRFYDYPLPDYCNDLNVMHEAEESLIGNLWIGYVNKLADIEGSLFGIRATARQRAEVFLRALGKWEEVAK